MNGGQIKKIIGIGASILSMVSMPFPRIIAKKLNLPYEEYSDNGISNCLLSTSDAADEGFSVDS